MSTYLNRTCRFEAGRKRLGGANGREKMEVQMACISISVFEEGGKSQLKTRVIPALCKAQGPAANASISSD